MHCNSLWCTQYIFILYVYYKINKKEHNVLVSDIQTQLAKVYSNLQLSDNKTDPITIWPRAVPHTANIQIFSVKLTDSK